MTPITSIGGVLRNSIAALDMTTGAATAWNPIAGGVVSALAVDGDTVYVGGNFATYGGQARNNIAALDATTGSATAWNPDANESVSALAVSDGIVYVAKEQAESPAGGDGNWSRRYGYALIDMNADGASDGNQGLWYRRNDICDTCTFGSWGKFRGDNYGENRANAPWNWRSVDRGPVRAGDMLCDPAFFFDAHLNGPEFDGKFSHVYLSNAFRTHSMPVSGSLKPSDGSWLTFANVLHDAVDLCGDELVGDRLRSDLERWNHRRTAAEQRAE